MSAFLILTLTCDDSTPGPPTVSAVDMMTGATFTPYVGNAPPTGFPSVARNGNGDVTITFAASYTDAYGVSAALTIRHASASLHGTTAGTVQPVISGSTVRLRAFDAAGSAISNAKITVEVAP